MKFIIKQGSKIFFDKETGKGLTNKKKVNCFQEEYWNQVHQVQMHAVKINEIAQSKV